MRIYNEAQAAGAALGGAHLAGAMASRESLAAFVSGGGEGAMIPVQLVNNERLAIGTPEGAASQAPALLDWLRVGGGPMMQRVRLVPVDTSTAAVGSESAAGGEYLAAVAASSAAADPTFRVDQLTPKHVGTLPIEVTLNVLATMPDADAWLMEGIRAALRRSVIKAILAGTGAGGQPTGIPLTTGIVEVAAPGALTALDFLAFETLQGSVAANQIEDRGGDLFVLSTAVARKAAQTLAETRGARRLLERRANTPDGMPYREIVGLGEAYRNADLAGNRAIYGDFSQVVVSLWGGPGTDGDGLYVIVDPVSTKPNIQIQAYLAFDVAVPQPWHFATALYT